MGKWDFSEENGVGLKESSSTTQKSLSTLSLFFSFALFSLFFASELSFFIIPCSRETLSVRIITKSEDRSVFQRHRERQRGGR